MKTIAAFLCLAVSASLGLAQTAPATKPANSKATPAKPAEPAGPAAKDAVAEAGKDGAKPKLPVKKEEPMGKIDGTTLVRPNGNFLGLTLMDGKYKLTFYEKKKKKPMKVDALRVIARWPNMHGPGNNQTILNPAGNGTFMLGQMFVRGPHAFVLNLTVILTEGDNAQTETYTVQFRG